MKPFVATLVAALAAAGLALAFDSWLLVLLSVAILAAGAIVSFVPSLRAAVKGSFVVPFIAVLAVGIGVAALAVAAIVLGVRGDAPGLVLLGSALIVTVIVGVFGVGLGWARKPEGS